jgi:hypothetical protein
MSIILLFMIINRSSVLFSKERKTEYWYGIEYSISGVGNRKRSTALQCRAVGYSRGLSWPIASLTLMVHVHSRRDSGQQLLPPLLLQRWETIFVKMCFYSSYSSRVPYAGTERDFLFTK